MAPETVAEILRLRYEADDDDRDIGQAPTPAAAGNMVAVARTQAKTSYPSTAGAFYWMAEEVITGAQTEGNSGTVAIGNANFYALNLGGSVPPVNTTVICHYVSNRWVFRYD